MTPLRIKLIIYALLYLTLHVVYGKHIMTRKFSGSNSTTIDGITCYACGLGDESTPVKHLSDCTNIQTCQLGEFCYLEHIYDMEKGTDYYVGGCRAHNICHLQTCVKDQLTRRQDHSQIVLCSECCSSSYCNGKLCNLPNDHNLNFTTCYSCTNIRDPKKCHTIVDCPPNEVNVLLYQFINY
ncbi:uncharacterized protein LOC134694230 [Mytilus trossulus]|uniref:uncharacterized protein LOC134694230 n=1 Tax=Mytilus trossulus TaxID=6551 RepID=UPI0030075599